MEEFTNVKVIAQAVRKENKFASKALLSKVGKTLMGRLSYIRHQTSKRAVLAPMVLLTAFRSVLPIAKPTVLSIVCSAPTG
ncbi:hypothetical protein BSPWISOXPB_5637 [uncultured Gammaproteobacteria bacterium]|nr:hypothetical protein BSPWISOXPB_5637 [uncultured Gammaproteobacteria bacterium]